MSTRLVEFTETFKIKGATLEAGTRMAFPTPQAERYLDMGVAKDPETGEQKERKPGATGPIVPESVQGVAR